MFCSALQNEGHHKQLTSLRRPLHKLQRQRMRDFSWWLFQGHKDTDLVAMRGPGV